MYRLILLISTLAAALIFAGCHFTDFSEEKANEAALSYLLEKYGEEFVAKEGGIRTDSIAFGNNWYELTVVKKSEEDEEPHREYTVCISVDDRKYAVIGDTVILDYYYALYEDYAAPIIAKEMGDIPYVMVISANYGRDGIPPEYDIPTELDDRKNYFEKNDFCFEIYIPESFDTGHTADLCKKIFNSPINENYRKGYIVILNDDSFASLAASEDKERECSEKNLFLQNKTYTIEFNVEVI